MSTPNTGDDEEKTVVGPSQSSDDLEKTQVISTGGSGSLPVSYEQTRVFTKPEKERRIAIEQGLIDPHAHPTAKDFNPSKRKLPSKNIIFAIMGLLFVSEFFSDEENAANTVAAKIVLPKLYKASLPSYSNTASDPAESKKNYELGMRLYVKDNPQAYKNAAQAFLRSTSLDIKNTKSLAMLASTYLNLLDASSKDDNYFSIITKLIEMSKAKTAAQTQGIDSAENVIAEVEFFISMHRPDAAHSRIVEYTKNLPNFGTEMFYYIAQVFFEKGDVNSAAKYLSQLGEIPAMGPRLFYFRGRVAEKLGQNEEALKEYRKAVKVERDHSKSKLRICSILNDGGKLQDAKSLLDEILERPELLYPNDFAQALYLRARSKEIQKKWKPALEDIQLAISIDKNNANYLFEYYTIRAKATDSGKSSEEAKEKAKMFSFLKTGEEFYNKGNYSEAVDQFLRARLADGSSTLPLIRIGDSFYRLGDYRNAAINYKKASDLNSKDVTTQAKYIDALIQGYEWEAAKTALVRLENMRGSRPFYYKLMGEFHAKQGQATAALGFFRQSMTLSSADPETYVGYAQLLLEQKNCIEAPFFFSMALRLDPTNRGAIVGIAKCHVMLDSIDRGIAFLQEEMQKLGASSVSLMTAIAEFQIQKGDYEQALQNLNQAESMDSNAVDVPKLKAQVYLAKSPKDKRSLQRALDYYAIYSEKNPGDPSGYMERYKIYAKKHQYDYALLELDKVLGVSPKYPGLRQAKAELYFMQGNRPAGIQELESEVKNNPGNPKAKLALAAALIDAQELQRAINLLEEAMRMDPGSWEIKYRMGLIQLMRRNYVPALALLQGAAQGDPGNPVIYRELVKTYLGLGDKDNASRAAQKYEELAPDAPDVKELQRQTQ